MRLTRGIGKVGLVALVLSGCATERAPEVSPPIALPPPTVSVTRAPPPERALLAAPPAHTLLPSTPSPPPPALLPAPAPAGPRSARLKSGFYNPMPGGVFAGYQADTGLDIAGSRLPVYALASGTLDYSEYGHTLWTGPKDTAYCIRFELDTPIPYKDKHITHVYYAHLSRLEYYQREGDPDRRHVEGGELLGVSGVARGSPHLHIGLLLDGEVDQLYWSSLLRANEIRVVMGGYKNGDRL
jgi:murein DD-endopeptidase MepM/ murein hydrolase activator NlpD